MKIALDTTINTLAGKPFTVEDKDLTLGTVLAEVLALETEGGKMKLYALAQKAFSDKVLDVDTADLALIKRAVENTKAYNGNNILLGQTLELLEKVK